MNEELNQSELRQSYKLTPCWNLLRNSLAWYWKNFKALLTMLLVMIVSVAATAILFTLGMMIIGVLPQAMVMAASIVGAILFIALVLLTIYFCYRGQIGLYLTIKNPEAGFKANFAASKALFWSGLGLSLLSGVMVLGWSLLLIVPGIVFWVFYSLAFFVFIFEGTIGYKAIKASKQLVKGYFWAVFGRYLYFGLFMFIINLIVGIPRLFMAEGSGVLMGYNFILQIGSYILTPWFIIYTYAIYRDLKKIKAQA